MKFKFLNIVLAGLIFSASCLVNVANAGVIGIDLDGNADDYTTSTSSEWTLGYEFNLSSSASVSGLGFFDLDGTYGSTTVGLWTSEGLLLGTVNTINHTVTETLTANGQWMWEFMDFSIELEAGDYVVGTWGESGSDFIFDGPITQNTLAYTNNRSIQSGNFSFPTNTGLYIEHGYFGANIMFEDSVSVPEPSTIAIFALGMIGLASRRFKK